MFILNFLKSIVFGIVEGISEWLPISSTGHMILLEKILPLNVSADFMSFYLVVIQLGAIMAVVVMFWKKIWPLGKSEETGKVYFKKNILNLWLKIIISCIPAVIVGLLIDDLIEKLFYNYICVAIALIVFGIVFIVLENNIKKNNIKPRINSINEIDHKTALYIGLFQVIAAIFPGTSRSGSTVIGGLFLGMKRKTIVEYTFYLSIPVMIGASIMKIMKIGIAFTFGEFIILLIGMAAAFIVSIFVIRFFLNYVKKKDFKIFGWYRIVLGIIVILFAIFS